MSCAPQSEACELVALTFQNSETNIVKPEFLSGARNCAAFEQHQPGNGRGVFVGQLPYSVTAAQVLIKWGLQKGLCVCVKSSNASRMTENLKEWWGLDMDDVGALDVLTTEEALQAWRAHYEKRRAGTAAPWGHAWRGS